MNYVDKSITSKEVIGFKHEALEAREFFFGNEAQCQAVLS